MPLNKTGIEYSDYSLNPIVGCKNGCWFCWAKIIFPRVYSGKFETPSFFPDRLNCGKISLPKVRNRIVQIISPSKPVVFLVDMGDIFSIGVKMEWICKIIEFCCNHPEANFLIHSKNSMMFRLFPWPSNCILVASVYNKLTALNAVNSFVDLKCTNTKICVIEPLIEDVHDINFDIFQYIIVGAMTKHGKRNVIPKFDWVPWNYSESIFFKDNFPKSCF